MQSLFQAFLALILAFVPQAVMADSYGPLAGAEWGRGSAATVVILHGDVSGGNGNAPARYHYDLAKRIAGDNRNAKVIALLRPGYFDGRGRQSPGNNYKRWDQYTKRNNDMVAAALKAIKAARGGAELIVVGHSGGAAQLGAVIGRYPGIVDTAILMSCPCHLRSWRQGRRQMKRSQSPHRYVGGVKSTRIVALTGQADKNTKPALAKDYVARARKAGLSADLIIVPGAGHADGKLYGALYRAVRAEVRN